jgi:hypothetical protein
MLSRAIGLLALTVVSVTAQTTTGTFVGTVQDSSGAVVSGARIRVTNAGTGAVIETASNENGDYVVSNLPPATYRLHAEMTGFRAVDLNDVRLLTNQTVRNDIRLEPGAVEQSITVEATAPVVNSETSSLANNVDTHTVVTLPLNGRTLDRLILITPGNTSDSPSNPKLAGSLHWGGNFFTIDGAAFNDLGNGGAAYSYQTQLSTTPSVDTIQEFKIETNNSKAENEGSAAIQSSLNPEPTSCTSRFLNSTATVSLPRSSSSLLAYPNLRSTGMSLAGPWADRLSRTRRSTSVRTKACGSGPRPRRSYR